MPKYTIHLAGASSVLPFVSFASILHSICLLFHRLVAVIFVNYKRLKAATASEFIRIGCSTDLCCLQSMNVYNILISFQFSFVNARDPSVGSIPFVLNAIKIWFIRFVFDFFFFFFYFFSSSNSDSSFSLPSNECTEPTVGFFIVDSLLLHRHRRARTTESIIIILMRFRLGTDWPFSTRNRLTDRRTLSRLRNVRISFPIYFAHLGKANVIEFNGIIWTQVSFELKIANLARV